MIKMMTVMTMTMTMMMMMRRRRSITMVIMMNVINDNDNGYVKISTNLEGSKEVVVGKTNIFIKNFTVIIKMT